MTIPPIAYIIAGGIIGIIVGVYYNIYRERHPRYKAFLLYKTNYRDEAMRIFGKKWLKTKDIDILEPASNFDGGSDIEIKQKVIAHAKAIKGMKRKTILHYKTTMGNMIVTIY